MRRVALPSLSISIAAISGAALAYEVLLTRLFSIIQWHHLAAMVISLALLGYGVSGTVLALARNALLSNFRVVYLGSLAAFGVAALACFAIAQRLAVNPEELLWVPAQMSRIAAMYLCLSVPFFFAASAVGLALAARTHDAGRLYAADLIGASAGAVVITALMFVMFPAGLLRAIATLGALAAVAGAIEVGTPRSVHAALLGLVALPWLVPGEWLALVVSPYKALSQQRQVVGATVVEERASPLGLLTVVANTRVTLRHAPGLALNTRGEVPEQLAVFTDADAMTAITRYDGERRSLEFLADTSSALPYWLAERRSVLVLGAGGGLDVLQALYFVQDGPATIDAVELNPQLVRLVRDHAEFAGGIYSHAAVRVHVADARGFLARSTGRYDLIQLAALDSIAAAAGGLRAASESYLYTVDAFEEYLAHLAPGGYLAVSGWVELPPRTLPKLFATAREALARSGVAEPGRSLALVRGWQTGTLLVKNGELTATEIARLKDFCAAHGFDTEWYPGIAASEANRVNRLPESYVHEAAVALLGEGRERFLDDYKLDLRPATDARPYFQHFFKWRTLPEILEIGHAAVSLLEAGYLLLVATFLQSIVASALLILLPLAALRRDWDANSASAWRVALYFLAVGFAFMTLEIAVIHELVLLLHHPVYAVTFGLAAFLLFAGIGSAASSRARDAGRALRFAVAGIVIAGCVCVLLDDLLAAGAGLPMPLRLALAVLAIGPLAFCMGFPFPLAIASLAREAPTLVPWAWGINGCASVVGAVGAALLAIHTGYGALIIAALGTYVFAASVFPLSPVASRLHAASA
jgi:SAM-dependent methyltransferase